MSRYNWMTVATWAVPIVCLVLAFTIGFYKYNQYSRTLEQENEIQTQIAAMEDKKKQLTVSPVGNLVLEIDPKNTMENTRFLAELRALIAQSGVTFKSWVNTTPEPLPSLNAGSAPGSTSSAGTTATTAATTTTNTSQPNSNQAATYSLTNLPRDARAISGELAVRGTYDRIRLFLYLLKNYRYTTRAININKASFSELTDQGQLTARLTLTRFVRPMETPSAVTPGAPASPGLTGTAAPAATSASAAR
ncbi:MAG TPA: hypothetical protein VFB38_02435 [Chthonomonadaceae bacterium]|nr:hypothetical protein [Chthonomonadaceae bacterium]